MSKKTETDQSGIQNADPTSNSPNGLRMKSNKNPNDEILLLEEKLYFGPGSEQIKLPLDILGFDDLQELESFSITMNVKVNTNLNNLKSDQVFFQVSSSVVRKNIAVGIAKDKTFYVSCLTSKNKTEICYTQCKVKNTEYHLGLTIADEGHHTEVTLYVNGQNEGALVFSSSLETLQGNFMFGSDASIGAFKGEISEAIFYIKVLSPGEIKECYLLSRSNQGDKSTYQIRKEKKAFLDSTEYYAKKKGVPVNLIRSHDIEKRSPKQILNEERKNDDEKQPEGEERKLDSIFVMIEKLKEYLYQDEEQYILGRELAANFEWVFNLCSVLSPPIEEQGLAPKHPFKCLHSALCDVETRYYPCYAISVDQFMKVIARTDSRFSRDEILRMNEKINCLDSHKDYGHFIYYDKFLVALRNAAFTKQEILAMNKSKYEEIDKQIVKSESPVQEVGPQGEQVVTSIVAYNLIPIFEGADYFDQREFIEANPDATLIKIILSIAKQTNHIKYIHFTYKLKNGAIRDYEVGKPILSGLPGMMQDLVHFTIDINDDEFITSVKASNYHSNNANRVINFLSIGLNTHPEGIAYGEFNVNAHPSELKTLSFDPSEAQYKRVLGFYGAFRDDLVGLGVYVEEKTIVRPPTPEDQKKPKEESPKVADDEEDGEYVLALPILKPDWNQGRMQLIINRCAECQKHRTTTSHEEADFCTRFNEWGDKIKEYFPNADIVGNYDKPKVLGIFEIYIRGVGTPAERDAEGRIFLHQNYTTANMKTSFAKVFETLVFLIFDYGDSIELAKAQDLYAKTNAKTIPKKWTGSHDHPVDLPERTSASPEKEKEKKKK